MIVFLFFCFNWNRVEAKSKTSRKEKGCTKLDHNRFRYYDSNSVIYINKDSIGLVGNNSYLYTYNDDSNTEVDPRGLSQGKAIISQYKNGLPEGHFTIQIQTQEG